MVAHHTPTYSGWQACGLLDPLIHFVGQENFHLPSGLTLLSSDILIFEY